MGIYYMYQIKFIDDRFMIKFRLIIVFVWKIYDLFKICCLEIISSEVIYMYYVLIVIKI